MKQPTLFILPWNENPQTSEFAPLFMITIISCVKVSLFPATPKHTLSFIYLPSPFNFSLYLCLFSARLCSTLPPEGSLPMDCVPLLLQSNWQTGTEFPLFGTDMLCPFQSTSKHSNQRKL